MRVIPSLYFILRVVFSPLIIAVLSLGYIVRVMFSLYYIEYLLDTEDPTHVYEQRGKTSAESTSSYEKGMSALSSLGRTQQIELISGYNDMKSSLTDYFKEFASNKKVIDFKDGSRNG